ncbi:ATP-binding cassette subfamily C protein [Gramella sp. Hel_I_59]|uniref:ATP-binding cassette domain-containing protein n=1 Tax=Gramella sp. Hel_I_59 TaxID=1249978 RepID=UPI00116FF018|nr:ABC transporter ATP-binding protein [Gramella sp. Hel_I_59]TQI71971.1 ATP-binding cassette subfamily C protein [Gramella sp. Hel_I_59]
MLLNFRPGKILLLFTLTLFLGVFSGLSIVLLIPLLQLLTAETSDNQNPIAKFFKELAEKVNFQLNLETILIIYVLLLSFMAVLQLWKSLLDARYQQRFIYEIRNRLFRKIIKADWQLLNNRSKTGHLQVLSTEIPNLADYFFFIMRVLTGLIMAGSYLVWAMFVSSKFTLFISFIGILVFILLRKFMFRAFDLGERFLDSYNHLLKYIDDFWTTVKIAKVHGSEAFYYKKFESVSSSLLKLDMKMQKNSAYPTFFYRISGIIVLTLVVYLGYKFDLIPLTSFFILIILFSKVYPQFTTISTDINIIISNFASVRMVMQLDENFSATNVDFSTPKNVIRLQNQLRITNLNFSYDNEELFHDFSASIPAFSLTGIIGESGKGKTTLIDLIAGLQQQKSGEIMVDDEILEDENLQSWRHQIGYLPQDAFFIDGTLRENLIWDNPGKISDKEIRYTLLQVRGSHLLDRLENGLDEVIVNYQFHFSGGERQRLALARVLLRQPQILLLDEATSSLDEISEKLIMELLVQLKSEITILFVTHRLSILPFCDKVIKLR